MSNKIFPNIAKQDEYWMKRCLELAENARGEAWPNPMVGAVLVGNDNQEISSGWHRGPGNPHAEAECLSNLNVVPEGSTLYVNLEPCNHHGLTPPCIDLLLNKKVYNLVVGMRDPNPKVNGAGLDQLRKSGVSIRERVLERECFQLNQFFYKYIRTGLPFVSVKLACTMDGKIAMPDGESQWISNKKSLEKAHYYRGYYGAVAVGKGTFIKDNPGLDNRLAKGPQPAGVVFWGNGEIPVGAKLFKSNVIKKIFVVDESFSGMMRKQEDIDYITYSETRNLKTVLETLSSMGFPALMVEGGPNIISEFLKANLVDSLTIFLAPKIIGNSSAPSWAGELGITKLSDAYQMRFVECSSSDGDLEIMAMAKEYSKFFEIV